MTDTNATHQTILVLGGTGKTGRRVAARLTERGVPVRIGSRSAQPSFQWEDRSTWPAVLDGVRAAYVTYVPDLSVPGAAADIAAFSALAREHGVQRLVLLSGRGEEGALSSERALADSGLVWTVVRASWFNQNFSDDYLIDAVRDGVLAMPVGDVAEPFVDADDIADVAVAALLDDGHSGEVYEVTGPRALTFGQVASTLATVTGHPVDFIPITSAKFVAGAVEQGVPADVAEMLSEVIATTLDGRNEAITDGVQRALGREPRDFADFASAAAATGIWNTEAGAPATAEPTKPAATTSSHV